MLRLLWRCAPSSCRHLPLPRGEDWSQSVGRLQSKNSSILGIHTSIKPYVYLHLFPTICWSGDTLYLADKVVASGALSCVRGLATRECTTLQNIENLMKVENKPNHTTLLLFWKRRGITFNWVTVKDTTSILLQTSGVTILTSSSSMLASAKCAERRSWWTKTTPRIYTKLWHSVKTHKCRKATETQSYYRAGCM